MKKLESALAEKKQKEVILSARCRKELEPFLIKLAHDLKQPLSAINMYAQGCARRLAAANYQVEDLIRICNKILEQSERVVEIINTVKQPEISPAKTRKIKPN